MGDYRVDNMTLIQVYLIYTTYNVNVNVNLRSKTVKMFSYPTLNPCIK